MIYSGGFAAQPWSKFVIAPELASEITHYQIADRETPKK
jgi:hypothetical protein